MTTPRDNDSLRIRRWADTGDTATPESVGLSRTTGFPSTYSEVGGTPPQLPVWNQKFLEITAMLREITQHGILSWDSRLNYQHPAIVLGSDGLLYMTRITNGPRTIVQDPTTDMPNQYWAPLDASLFGGQVTAAALEANGDIGPGSTQIARGNHSH